MSPLSPLLLWAFLAAVMGGCSPSARKGQVCSSNEPCPAGQTCQNATGAATPSASTGVCVLATGPSQDQIFLEFHDAAQLYPPLQMSITLSIGQNQSFVLRTPLPVSGTITLPGDPPITPTVTPVAGADVRLSAHTGIPGRLVQLDTVTSATGAYSLMLPLGSYSIEVIPLDPVSGQTMPPIYLGDTSTDIIKLPLSFSLPPPSTLPSVTGTVTLADGSPIPSGGIQVTATDASLLDNLPGQVPPTLATPVVTTNGAFNMLLSPKGTPTPDAAQLQFSASPVSALPFPTFNGAVQPLDLSMVYPGGGVLSPVVIPLDVYAEPVQVSGVIENAEGAPVTGAPILFLTQPGKEGLLPPFTYAAAVSSDPMTGTFTASLFQAWDTSVAYSVLAAPSLGASDISSGSPGLCSPVGGFPALESREADLNAPPPDGGVPEAKMVKGVVLKCSLRVKVTGLVVDANGQGVGNVFVQAALQPTSDFPSELQFETTTDGGGSFKMWLPSGEYTFTLTPPVQDNLPVSVLSGITLSKSTPLTLPISKPFNLFGQIFIGNTNTPFTGTVTAYESDGSTSVPVGSSAIGSDGRYSIIVPDFEQ